MWPLEKFYLKKIEVPEHFVYKRNQSNQTIYDRSIHYVWGWKRYFSMMMFRIPLLQTMEKRTFCSAYWYYKVEEDKKWWRYLRIDNVKKFNLVSFSSSLGGIESSSSLNNYFKFQWWTRSSLQLFELKKKLKERNFLLQKKSPFGWK